MPEFLKGNYKVDATIEDKAVDADSTDEFEKKALSKLGGSICFVSKKSLMWQGEEKPQASRATPMNGEEKPQASRATPMNGEEKSQASRATPKSGDDKAKTDGAGTKDR